MKPAQLIRTITEPIKESCEVPIAPGSDYALAAGMTPYSLVMQKQCPVCGSKGSTEHYEGEHPASFFFCSLSKAHIYEFDKDEGTADRIEVTP